MTVVAVHLDDLRIAVGETEALTSFTAESYDRQDWIGADPLHAERLASLLGLISKSVSAAFHRLHRAVADAQPAPAGKRWDYGDGTGQRRVDEQSTTAGKTAGRGRRGARAGRGAGRNARVSSGRSGFKRAGATSRSWATGRVTCRRIRRCWCTSA
jgi:hypothetical protein